MDIFIFKTRTRKNSLSNIQTTNESLYSNSPFSHRRELSKNSSRKKSILKIHELQNELKEELKSKINFMPISPKNNLFENYTKASININQWIRNIVLSVLLKEIIL